MEIKRFNKNSSPETLLRALVEDAAIIIENLITTDLVQQIAIELQPYLETCNSGKSEFSGLSTKRIGALIAAILPVTATNIFFADNGLGLLIIFRSYLRKCIEKYLSNFK